MYTYQLMSIFNPNIMGGLYVLFVSSYSALELLDTLQTEESR
jgi:hypothetical protein